MTATNLQPHCSTPRKWLFRGASVFAALLSLVLLEFVCVLAGWGQPDPTLDPYVEFSSVRPLFELDSQSDRYIVSPTRRKFFASDEFPAQKPTNGYRIFCLGGSTVQGRPYSIETSFATFLELALHEMDSETDWDVINCGGISYASYRLVPILEECLNYEPDLIILCTGHNEFLEERQYARVKHRPTWVNNSLTTVNQFRTTKVLQRLVSRSPSKATLNTEVQARLDFQHGLAKFHRDPEWTHRVEQHFAANIERMVQLANKRGTPMVLVKPCSNLSDTRPFKVEPNNALSKEQQQLVVSLIKQARSCVGTDLVEAAALYEQALDIDPLQAAAWFELGECLQLRQQLIAAKVAFQNARDLDVCPLRMTTPLEESFTAVAKKHQLPLLDAHQLLEDKTQPGILGDDWLVDHVHPSFDGHQEIALALAEMFVELEVVTPNANWKPTAQQSFTTHFEALDRNYFHRGQRMLKALQGWTRGEAEDVQSAH